jgi:hypothetical protein
MRFDVGGGGNRVVGNRIDDIRRTGSVFASYERNGVPVQPVDQLGWNLLSDGPAHFELFVPFDSRNGTALFTNGEIMEKDRVATKENSLSVPFRARRSANFARGIEAYFRQILQRRIYKHQLSTAHLHLEWEQTMCPPEISEHHGD